MAKRKKHTVISARPEPDYGVLVSSANLQQMRPIYLGWQIRQTLSGELGARVRPTQRDEGPVAPIFQTSFGKSRTGQILPTLWAEFSPEKWHAISASVGIMPVDAGGGRFHPIVERNSFRSDPAGRNAFRSSSDAGTVPNGMNSVLRTVAEWRWSRNNRGCSCGRLRNCAPSSRNSRIACRRRPFAACCGIPPWNRLPTWGQRRLARSVVRW